VALALAATSRDLVDGVVLMSSGARVYGDATPDELGAARQWNAVLADRWGTDDTVTLELFASMRPARLTMCRHCVK
jgi:hypothetical protein